MAAPSPARAPRGSGPRCHPPAGEPRQRGGPLRHGHAHARAHVHQLTQMAQAQGVRGALPGALSWEALSPVAPPPAGGWRAGWLV